MEREVNPAPLERCGINQWCGVKRVLIFRHGSLGDTVVALPSFRLIATAFPSAERRVLTTVSVNEHAAPLSALLDSTGLVHDSMVYPDGGFNAGKLLKIRKEILAWKPDLLIYLAEPRGPFSPWRDALFFKWCDIRKLAGVPYAKSLREHQWLPGLSRFEHESERLVRCLSSVGKISLEDAQTWNLHFTEEEIKRADQCLENWEGAGRFIACNVAAKEKSKDWGRKNWRELLARLSSTHSSLGLVMIGAQAGAPLSQEAMEAWNGPRLNLCGRVTLRECASVLKRALFYLGHDSGPMHLAAAVGISCVAVFVECKKPGVWFPYGKGHRVVYRETNGKRPAPITVEEVLEATQDMIGEKLHARTESL